ncbi:hypothetical protein AwDysgo_02280 [Bacteroidales bacterium]|nr:hypothetical protein AwDysgo_02280 [Bacteroidales bacterium]
MAIFVHFQAMIHPNKNRMLSANIKGKDRPKKVQAGDRFGEILSENAEAIKKMAARTVTINIRD